MTILDKLKNDIQVIIQPHTLRSNLVAECHECHSHITINAATYYKRKMRDGDWLCPKCIRKYIIEKSKSNPLYKDEQYKEKFRQLHQDPEYAAKVHNKDVYEKISQSSKLAWQDDSKRANHLAHRSTAEFKQRISEWNKANWKDPEYIKKYFEYRHSQEYHDKASASAKKLWENTEYRQKITEILHKARPNSFPKTKISSLQKILYKILYDMGLQYYEEGPETIIGPIITSNNQFEGYSWDCLLVHNNTKYYIDVHGWYYHQENREASDRAKATFMANYFPEHKVIIIWEHEFRSHNIKKLIETKIGIEAINSPIDFNIRNVQVKKSDITDDIKTLFASYHYLGNIGRYGSVRYCAFHGDELIAACVFSHPTRQESAKRLGISSKHVLELTRFCINPNYQKKNLASWFLGRCMRMLKADKPNTKMLLTFADSTHGHTGTIYKASNWKLDGIVRPDYWYVGVDGAWYHKKSIWDIATKCSMSEHDYALKHSLSKITGKEKYRYTYNLS